VVGDVVFELLELDVVDLEVLFGMSSSSCSMVQNKNMRLKVSMRKKSVEMQRPEPRKLEKRCRYDRKQRHYCIV
jgi:hypothetical protein